MALMNITVIPLATETTGLSPYIAELARELTAQGVTFQLNDMGTVVEAEVSELLRIAAVLHEIPFRQGIQRVVTSIQIDDRRDRRVHLGDKVRAVDGRLATP